MSESQSVVELNYMVDVICNSLDELSAENIKDVSVSNTDRKIKKNLKTRISEKIVKNFESVGSTHLRSGTINNSNTRSNSSVRSVHFGGSGGRTTNIPDSSVVQFRLGIVSFIDYEDSISRKDFKSMVTDLWSDVKSTLEDETICIDSVGDKYGILKLSKPDTNWSADRVDPQIETERYQTSGLNKSEDPALEKTLNSAFGPGFESGSHLETSIDSDSRRRDVHPENPFDDYDPVSEFIEAYNGHDNSVYVRKPTEDEIEPVIRTIYKRIVEIFESDDPIYLERIPEEWRNATCSRCDNDDVDLDVLISKFEDKNKEVIKHRLKQDFGINSDSNKFKSTEVTNFFVTENAEIMIRPEEVISWIISICHHVEPYCEVCHNEIIGNNHQEFSERLVETRKADKNIDESKDPVSDGINTENTMHSYEKIDIDKEIDIDSENFQSSYRSPTHEERNQISNSIYKHLIKLGARLQDNNTQSNAVYNTLFDRDNSEKYHKTGYIKCQTCNSPLVSPDSDTDLLGTYDKHHIEPISSNRIPSIINKVRGLLDRSVGANAKEAPVKVSEQGDRYLFSDQFLSLVETLYRNVDTIALWCDDCETYVQSPENGIHYELSEQEAEDDTDESDENILEMSYEISGKNRFDFICQICKGRNKEQYIHEAVVKGFSCICTQNGQRTVIPVYTKSFMTHKKPIGLCPKHKRLIDSTSEIPSDIVEQKGKKEKVRSLFTWIRQNYT